MYKFLIFLINFISISCYNPIIIHNNKLINFNYNNKIKNSKILLNEIEDNANHIEVEQYKNNSYDILFYGPVNDYSCLKLNNALLYLDKVNQNQNENKEISLHIQSYGGSLLPSFYVCDVIKNLNSVVNTHIDGYAASAASLISVCGNNRYISKNSHVLIHQLSTAQKGKAAELEDEYINVKSFMSNLKDIYLENTKLNEDKLEKLLLRDLWLNSSTALEYGIVDAIL